MFTKLLPIATSTANIQYASMPNTNWGYCIAPHPCFSQKPLNEHKAIANQTNKAPNNQTYAYVLMDALCHQFRFAIMFFVILIDTPYQNY
jgi:hypothetical protein